MARIVVLSVDGFVRALERLARPETHIVVTDEASSISLVPRVSSRHRHYITYNTRNPEEVRSLAEKARSKGYEVLTGFVQMAEV